MRRVAPLANVSPQLGMKIEDVGGEICVIDYIVDDPSLIDEEEGESAPMIYLRSLSSGIPWYEPHREMTDFWYVIDPVDSLLGLV